MNLPAELTNHPSDIPVATAVPMDTNDPPTMDMPLIQGIFSSHQAEVNNASLSTFGSVMLEAT
eukprot:5554102-Ditylum_brightwellii.AAC.1